jgi:hypothetical protein
MRNAIAIDVCVAVYIDVHGPAAPVPVAPTIVPGGPYSDAGGEADYSRSNGPSVRIVRIRRISRIRPGSVDHRRVIGGHIDRCGAGRFDHNRFPFDFHLLLVRGFQITLSLSLGAQLLDSVHDIGLLSQESITQRLGPFQLFAHHGKNFWEGHQRFHAEVPFHLVQGGVQLVSLEVLVLLHPTVRRYDFERKGRRYQYVSEQGVRVESNWSKHLIERFRPKCRGSSCLLPKHS